MQEDSPARLPDATPREDNHDVATNWFEERDKHRRSPAPRDGLARMARSIAPGSTVARIRRLGGGLGCATHALDLRKRSGVIVPLVLKRFRSDDTYAKREWDNLRFAERIAVPTPEPIAFDPKGEWFNGPAMVMERLDGRADHFPSDPGAYFDQIAAALVEIQSTSTSRIPKAVRTFPPSAEWALPAGLRRTELVRRADETIRRTLARAIEASEHVVCHGDLHPGNLLWKRGKLTGVIDWTWAKVAPPSFDVAYCRADLVVVNGVRAAEMFLASYERLRGSRASDLATWDLTRGLAALDQCPFWAIAYGEQGADVDPTRAKERVRRFLRRALDS
jgi:aminoglycoside phosphotransferase (APT) family kinase protein